MYNYKTILAESEAALSNLFDLSLIQDSFCFRNVRRSRLLAEQLVNEAGVLERKSIDLAAPFYPRGFSDALILRHHQKFLKRWNEDEIFFKSFKKFSRPLCHRGAERLVRESLLLSPTVPITDAHIRKAVVSAALTLLRQNIGSCFATAPAIVIHEEMTDSFIQDLYDLLTTGKLKRTFGGVEYTVPLNLSWGVGDLRKSIFQIGGNLFASPGLMAVYETSCIIDSHLPLDKKIEAQYKLLIPYLERGKEISVEELLNATVPTGKIEEAKAIFRGVADHALLKAWEFTLASLSEVKMEFSRWNLYISLGLHPEEKGGIGQVLYQTIDQKLQASNQKTQEFQREYETAFDQLKAVEALLRRASSESEAKRLQAEAQSRFYHMRSCEEMRDKHHNEAKQFSMFFSFLLKQYDALFPEYFQEAYDPEMVELSSGPYNDSPAGFRLFYKHGRADASLWTSIQNEKEYIRFLTEFFSSTETSISSACTSDEEESLLIEATSAVIRHVRSDEFLSFALQRMKKNGRTPWSYISGGTMETLLKTYFRRESALAHEERRVESPLDLLTFLLDLLKSLPSSATKMLMHSPTHAFILQPGWEYFRQGWQDSGFTYTWIRDQFLKPAQEFYEGMILSPAEQALLAQRLGLHVSTNHPLTLAEFCSKLPKTPETDAFLYQSLPLIPRPQCQTALQQFGLRSLPELPPFLPSFELQTLAKTLLSQVHPNIDHHLVILDYFQKHRLAPRPLLFADTNWANNYFAFVVNPSSLELELWRTDRTGSTGAPMTSWRPYLYGQEKITWGIYTQPLM